LDARLRLPLYATEIDVIFFCANTLAALVRLTFLRAEVTVG